jgi:type IV pilus assembly protein PilN
LDKELTELRSELQIFNGKAKEVSLIQTKMKEYQSKLQVLESINKKKAGPSGVMDSLSAATPGTLWLTEFRETGGNVTITGVAADNQTIAEFLKALSSYPFFKETELVETTQSDQPGLPPRRFSIKSKLFYQPQAEPATKDKGGVQPVATKSGQ